MQREREMRRQNCKIAARTDTRVSHPSRIARAGKKERQGQEVRDQVDVCADVRAIRAFESRSVA